MSACEGLAAQASGGVGPALAAVDCLANEMAAGAFSRLFGTQGGLLPALTLLLTLYIALFAFALITGRSRIGVSVLTPRMVTLGVVLTFATSWMAWQQVVWNLAIGAPDQIAALIMGTKGPATRLFADRIDMVLAAISAAGEAVGSTAASAASGGGAFSPQGVMWLAAMLLLLGTVGVLVTARIALAVLLAVGPVFVVMGLFRQTRGLTAGWARALVLAALTPLFVVAGGSLMLELAVPVVAGLDGGMGSGQPGIDARAAMALFLIAAVHCALMTMMMKVAGTMVSGWSVFGLGGQDEREGATVAAAAAVAAARAADPASAAPAAAAAVRPRAPALAATLAPPAAADGSGGPGSGPASVRRSTTVIQPGAAAPTLPLQARTRARGIGSRFAAPRTPARRAGGLNEVR